MSKRQRIELMERRCVEAMKSGYRIAVDLSLEDLMSNKVRTKSWFHFVLYNDTRMCPTNYPYAYHILKVVLKDAIIGLVYKFKLCKTLFVIVFP